MEEIQQEQIQKEQESQQIKQVEKPEQEVQDQQSNEPEVKVQEQSNDKGAYTLKHDRPNCIGCAACEAVAPDFWEMNEDGKSDIKSGKNVDNGWQELNFEEKDFEINKEAADSCPVNVIHIEKKDTKEKII